MLKKNETANININGLDIAFYWEGYPVMAVTKNDCTQIFTGVDFMAGEIMVNGKKFKYSDSLHREYFTSLDDQWIRWAAMTIFHGEPCDIPVKKEFNNKNIKGK